MTDRTHWIPWNATAFSPQGNSKLSLPASLPHHPLDFQPIFINKPSFSLWSLLKAPHDNLLKRKFHISRDFYCQGVESNIACENSRPSSLPTRVAFRENDVCDLPPKIPYWWRKGPGAKQDGCFRRLKATALKHFKFRPIIVWIPNLAALPKRICKVHYPR